MCALVYRPPKPDRHFIKEFSDFLSHYATSYDRLLIILGDFNIHVCCPSKPLVREFCHVMESFGLLQHINQATHVHGHTLDLILSHGFSIDSISIEDAFLTDHVPFVFNIKLFNSMYTPRTLDHFSHHINHFTANKFSECYLGNDITASITAHDHLLSPDELISSFNTSCLAVLETVAPLKLRRPNFKPQQWLDDSTCHLRQVCRRAERKWKKDHLLVSLEIFRNSMANFQAAAKKDRVLTFSDIISKHSHCPRILFNTINSIVNLQRSRHPLIDVKSS